jgi:hypothetical protein
MDFYIKLLLSFVRIKPLHVTYYGWHDLLKSLNMNC